MRYPELFVADGQDCTRQAKTSVGWFSDRRRARTIQTHEIDMIQNRNNQVNNNNNRNETKLIHDSP